MYMYRHTWNLYIYVYTYTCNTMGSGAPREETYVKERRARVLGLRGGYMLVRVCVSAWMSERISSFFGLFLFVCCLYVVLPPPTPSLPLFCFALTLATTPALSSNALMHLWA